jgi:hypothetical protein
MADGAGFLSAYERNGSTVGMGEIIAMRSRSYAKTFRPTESQVGGADKLTTSGYDAGQFFFWAGLRYGGAGYLKYLYDRPFPKNLLQNEKQAAGRDIFWIDRWMTKAPRVKTGLAFLYPQFVADYGSWGENFFQHKDYPSLADWISRVFGRSCHYMYLTPDNPFVSQSIELDPISTNCVVVHVDESFSKFVALDAFAFSKGKDQFRRLDSIHLSTIFRRSPGGTNKTCEERSGQFKPRTWPTCVVKPYLYENAKTKLDFGNAQPTIRREKKSSTMAR